MRRVGQLEHRSQLAAPDRALLGDSLNEEVASRDDHCGSVEEPRSYDRAEQGKAPGHARSEDIRVGGQEATDEGLKHHCA